MIRTNHLLPLLFVYSIHLPTSHKKNVFPFLSLTMTKVNLLSHQEPSHASLELSQLQAFQKNHFSPHPFLWLIGQGYQSSIWGEFLLPSQSMFV